MALNYSDLHDYQLKLCEIIKEEKTHLLAVSMGLGKTASTLTAIADLLDSFAINKVIVFAPLRVANSVWKQEISKWEHLKHLRVSVCTGSERQRLAALQAPADIYVINRENSAWIAELFRKKWPFDMTVIDESSSYKSSKSQRFKALKRVIFGSDYRILLSGTPAPNGVMDLWSQMYLVDSGERLGKTMLGYKQKYFAAEDYMGFNYQPKKGAVDTIHSLVSDKMVSMSASDYLDLPECVNIEVPVYLPADAMKKYKEFEKTSLANFPVDIEIEAINAAVLAGKLLQFASGSVYYDAVHNYHVIHDAKLDALEEIIEDNAGENIIVAYYFKSDLERLQKRFPKGVVLDKKQETIDKWNRGEIKLLFLHSKSAGHGLNIQAGGSILVWFSLIWSLEEFQQTNARLDRQGQDKPVRIFTLVAQDTIDQRVVSVLSDKDATQKSLLRALRA